MRPLKQFIGILLLLTIPAACKNATDIKGLLDRAAYVREQNQDRRSRNFADSFSKQFVAEGAADNTLMIVFKDDSDTHDTCKQKAAAEFNRLDADKMVLNTLKKYGFTKYGVTCTTRSEGFFHIVYIVGSGSNLHLEVPSDSQVHGDFVNQLLEKQSSREAYTKQMNEALSSNDGARVHFSIEDDTMMVVFAGPCSDEDFHGYKQNVLNLLGTPEQQKQLTIHHFEMFGAKCTLTEPGVHYIEHTWEVK